MRLNLPRFKSWAYLAFTFVIFLLSNLLENNGPLPGPDGLKTVLGLAANLLVWPLFLGGFIGVLFDFYRNGDDPFQLVKFIRYAGRSYLGILFINLLLLLTVTLILLPLSLLGLPGDTLYDIVFIPLSMLKLFWIVSIVMERKLFKSLGSGIRILLRSRQALIAAIVYSLSSFADSMVPQLLPGGLPPSAIAIVAVLRALIFAVVIFYCYYWGAVIYGDVKELRTSEMTSTGSTDDAGEAEEAHKPGMLLIAASFIPVVGIFAFVKGVLSLKKVKAFSIRPLAACFLGAFFTLIYAFMAVGLLLPQRNAVDLPGYRFLAESNPALQDQVTLLDEGRFDEVIAQLDSGKAGSADWTVLCTAAIAESHIPGRELEALGDFGIAASYKPDKAEFYLYYADTLLEQGEYEAAKENAATAADMASGLKGARQIVGLTENLYEPSRLVSGLLLIVILFILFTSHEYAHAYAAWRLGDDTPLEEGRLTLNPIAHLDPVGSVLLPAIMLVRQSGFIFGWAKPVHINPENLRDPKRDAIRVSVAGPSINVLLAFVTFIFILLLALLVRLVFPGVLALNLAEPYAPVSIAGTGLDPALSVLFFILKQLFYTSLLLGFFNLLPIPPLDGSHILSALLPGRWMDYFARFRAAGSVLFLLLIISPVFDYVMAIPVGLFWAILHFTLSALGMA